MKVIVNLPVSMKCNMTLFASGSYSRKHVEKFIKMLQLHIELGAFDSDIATEEEVDRFIAVGRAVFGAKPTDGTDSAQTPSTASGESAK